MVMDRSKEQTFESFRKKFYQADLHIKQTETYCPWQIQAEGNIRDLKKGAGRRIFWAGPPKRIWDDALEFEAYMRSKI